jgi:hypothetical protein
MPFPMPNDNVSLLVGACLTEGDARRVLALLQEPAELEGCQRGQATRLEISHAMNAVLFHRLVDSVGAARDYVNDVEQANATILLDHGAIRTVRWPHNGALPPGEAAFTRFLRPLGFALARDYPLTRLRMTGRAYYHLDAPESTSQFFISELHPERYSPGFQQAVTRVVGGSTDPLTPAAQAALWELERDGTLPLPAAADLLRVLVRCFSRQHPLPTVADHQRLAAESHEMAWISTEGNTFNHATTRVDDVEAVAQAQRGLGRPIKDDVEVSLSGRVLQTAFLAEAVERELAAEDGSAVRVTVPGSFYEFITRRRYLDKSSGRWRTDLGFDAGNAQQIFKMTSAAAAA